MINIVTHDHENRLHKFRAGDVVIVHVHISRSPDELIRISLSGRCRLYVVALERDCDGEPIYTLSDIPVRYPESASSDMRYAFFAKLVRSNVRESDLRWTGSHLPVLDDVDAWISSSFDAKQRRR